MTLVSFSLYFYNNNTLSSAEYSWPALSAEGQCSCHRSVSTGWTLWSSRLFAKRVSSSGHRNLINKHFFMLIYILKISFCCDRRFSSVKNELLPSHPLELSEKNVSKKVEWLLECIVLQNISKCIWIHVQDGWCSC